MGHTQVTIPSLGLHIYVTMSNELTQRVVVLDTNLVLGEGNGTPLQYSCLENPMDGGAWKAAVHGVAEGRIGLGDFTFRVQTGYCHLSKRTQIALHNSRNIFE